MMEIHQAIVKVKPGKSPGPDGLAASYYKKLEDILSVPLKTVMNKLLKEGILPESWQEAFITLIPKQGTDLTSTKNYRPICILNNDYKLFKM